MQRSQTMLRLGLFVLMLLVLVGSVLAWSQEPANGLRRVRFAAIGDYGAGNDDEQAVAQLVASWNPDFIITLGDNNYPDGEAATIDDHIGQFYSSFIGNYTGKYGTGSDTNRFFPALGNHDWNTPDAQPYLDYFTLPGNERYYDFVRGPVHFFVIDSDSQEPDGITADSVQAAWLRAGLAAAPEPWKLVYFHHSPFSSGRHGNDTDLQWPFQEWGATAVLTGHDHTYERIVKNGFPYFINGLGGQSVYDFGTPVEGSAVRYNDNFGAMLIEASDASLIFSFITIDGAVVDSYTLTRDVPIYPMMLPVVWRR